MSIVLVEGFDHYTAAAMTAKGWTSSPASMQAGRLGGQCSRFGQNASSVKSLPGTYTTLTVGFGFRCGAAQSADKPIAYFRVGITQILRIEAQGTTNRVVIKNNGGTVIGTSTLVMGTGIFYYIEASFLINGASGTCELHVNGAVEIAQTTGNFGSTGVENIQIGPASGSLTGSYDYDDLYVANDATFRGDCRVETVMPTGAGANTDWTPDSGSNYVRVNETLADDDTSFVYDSTPGHQDTYAFADLVSGGGGIKAIQVNAYARKSDAGARTIAPVVRTGGVDHTGDTLTPGTNYTFLGQIYQQDPSSVDWTPASINAAEFGVELKA